MVRILKTTFYCLSCLICSTTNASNDFMMDSVVAQARNQDMYFVQLENESDGSVFAIQNDITGEICETSEEGQVCKISSGGKYTAYWANDNEDQIHFCMGFTYNTPQESPIADSALPNDFSTDNGQHCKASLPFTQSLVNMNAYVIFNAKADNEDLPENGSGFTHINPTLNGTNNLYIGQNHDSAGDNEEMFFN